MQDAPLPETRAVPAQWPAQLPCRIALVGEAPGEAEVEKLAPFVGPSGKLLNSMLRTAEIDRELCLVTNVYDTKLDENEVSKHAKRLGEAWPQFRETNLLRLEGELAKAKPNVVIALGATAFGALTGIGGIAAYRGTVRMGEGPFASYKVVPTYHPAAILRMWKHYTVAVGDLVRAARESDTPVLSYPKRALYITPTIEEVEDFLGPGGPCQNTDLLSVDIETGWGQIRGVNFAPNQFEAIYVPFIWLANINRSYWPSAGLEKRAWLAVRECLQSDVPKLGQNFANYDVVWLLEKLGIRVRNLCHDLRLLHKSLYPELPADLQFMGAAYSRQGAWKHWGKGARHAGSGQDKRDN